MRNYATLQYFGDINSTIFRRETKTTQRLSKVNYSPQGDVQVSNFTMLISSDLICII